MRTSNVLENPAIKKSGNVRMGTDAGMDRTIVNPIFKDTATFLKTPSETFTALQGNLGVKAGGKTIILKPGETFTVPIGVVHNFLTPDQRQSDITSSSLPGSKVLSTCSAFCTEWQGMGKQIKKACLRV